VEILAALQNLYLFISFFHNVSRKP